MKFPVSLEKIKILTLLKVVSQRNSNSRHLVVEEIITKAQRNMLVARKKALTRFLAVYQNQAVSWTIRACKKVAQILKVLRWLIWPVPSQKAQNGAVPTSKTTLCSKKAPSTEQHHQRNSKMNHNHRKRRAKWF